MGNIGPGELVIIVMILGLVSAPVGLIVVIVVLARRGLRCVGCRRRVAKLATVCPHCGALLDPAHMDRATRAS